MAIEFDPTRDACGAAEGVYRYDGQAHSVAICTRPGSTFRADLQRRRTLLHEFAHAWETVNLDDAERNRFMARFGLVGWNDPDDRWEDRGAERFAEIFVLALLDQPLRQLKVPFECAPMVRCSNRCPGTPRSDREPRSAQQPESHPSRRARVVAT